jgi:hypothetical protein
MGKKGGRKTLACRKRRDRTVQTGGRDAKNVFFFASILDLFEKRVVNLSFQKRLVKTLDKV